MSLLKNVLQRILPTPILYVRFKKNELEIKHIQSGKEKIYAFRGKQCKINNANKQKLDTQHNE